jgi:predicted acyl esterase
LPVNGRQGGQRKPSTKKRTRNERKMFSFLSALLIAVVVVSASAKDVPFQGNRVVETMVTMRDGVQLHTVIVFPRDSSDKSNQFTTLVDRSPYGYGDLEWIADIFVPFGFVAIGQDMRGTEKSQGDLIAPCSPSLISRCFFFVRKFLYVDK